ncbi:MAG: Esterase, partial [Mycobacterium sp.]|nr:Esterase [Mycobacterium sp.]
MVTALKRRRHYPVLRAVAEVLNAANAVRPLGREGYLTLPVFAFGWPTGEATPVVAGASMLDAARRALRGDFKGRRGRIAFALTVLAWGLLGFVYYRGSKSQDHFEGPLRETLGEDYASIAAEERRRRRSGVLRTSWARRQYVKKTDIVRYGPHRANVADVWHRADLPLDGRAPVLLQVPGGAWAIGMRRPQAYPLMTHMAERGWICVSMAYRVSPRNTWPA